MDAQKDIIDKIKSKYILKQIFHNLKQNKMLTIIQYNKNLQNKLGLGIEDYKYSYEKIIVEIIPKQNFDCTYSKYYFIRLKNNDERYYHIYFDDNKEEIKRPFFNKNEKVKKIKIIIDYEIKSFFNLFHNCDIIERINFIQFNRNDIIDMSFMFCGCSSLKELNLSNFKTNNVKDMSYIFYGCTSLNELKDNNQIILNKSNADKIRNLYELSKTLKKNNRNKNEIRKTIYNYFIYFPIIIIISYLLNLYFRSRNVK